MSEVKKTAFLEIDTRCRFNCKHCYLKEKGRHLTVEQAMDRINLLKKKGYEVITIWGEILDHPKFLQVVQASGQDGISTTGVPLLEDPNLAQQLPSYGIEEIRISSHYYAKSLGLSPIKLEQVKQIAKIANNARVRTRAHVILWQGNYDKVFEICKRAIDDGLCGVRLLNLIPTNPNLAKFCLSKDQVYSIFEQVEFCRDLFSIDVLHIKMSGTFGPRPGSVGAKMSKACIYCPAGKENIFVKIDGSIFPCFYLTEKHNCIGKLDDKNETIIFTNPNNLNRSTCFFSHL